MRAIILAAALAAAAAPQAWAGDTTAASQATSAASTQSTASNAGNSQSITSTSPSKQTVYEVPTQYTPALAASFAGCMGSTSVGAAWAGFGLSGGKTLTDAQCERRANAEMLNGLGERATAVQLMCADPDIRKADALSARRCK